MQLRVALGALLAFAVRQGLAQRPEPDLPAVTHPNLAFASARFGATCIADADCAGVGQHCAAYFGQQLCFCNHHDGYSAVYNGAFAWDTFLGCEVAVCQTDDDCVAKGLGDWCYVHTHGWDENEYGANPGLVSLYCYNTETEVLTGGELYQSAFQAAAAAQSAEVVLRATRNRFNGAVAVEISEL